jgi:UDP-glucuronate decarboxylase
MSFDRNYKDGSILATGGADFIGSRLDERLLAAGAEVVRAENYFTGSRKVTFPLYIEVDEIFHLACPASPIHYQRNPVQTTKTGV